VTAVYKFTLDGTEKLLRAAGVAAALERLTSHRPHISGVRRLWRRPNKHGVVLPSVVVGATRYSSAQAVRWYVETTTAAAANDIAQQNGGTVTQGAPLSPGEQAVLARFGIASQAV
jgi:hypothetical protein